MLLMAGSERAEGAAVAATALLTVGIMMAVMVMEEVVVVVEEKTQQQTGRVILCCARAAGLESRGADGQGRWEERVAAAVFDTGVWPMSQIWLSE